MKKRVYREFVALLALLPAALSAQRSITLPDKDKPLAGQPAQLFSIGAEDGEEWELLAGVRGVAFDAKDNLYILDGNNYRVLVFDANGKFVRKISKKGEGPGELMAPVAMTVSADDNIVISDIGRRTFSIFKPDGTFLKNVTFPDGQAPGLGDITTSTGLQAHPRAGVIARSTPMIVINRGAGGVNPGALNGERSAEFSLYDLASSKVTQLRSVKMPAAKTETSDAGSTGTTRRFSVRMQRPNFEPPTAFGVLPDGGIAIAHDVGYRIELVSPSGTVERTIDRPSIGARKVTDRDKRRVIELQREAIKSGSAGTMQVRVGSGGGTSFSSGGGPPGELPSVDKMLEDAIFMDSIPVVRRIETDPQGRVWIGRTAGDLGPRGPVDLVAADGRYIGTLASAVLPNAVSRSGRAAYIERDENGVEHVVVKRLPPTWQ